MGRFAVELWIDGDAYGSELVVEEHAVEGFVTREVLGSLLDAVIVLRNRERCRRFRGLVARRQRRASGGAYA